MASLVFTIAKETGWPERQILRMPLARLLQYLHACWRSHDVWTVDPSPSKEAQLEELNALSSYFDIPSEEEDTPEISWPL